MAEYRPVGVKRFPRLAKRETSEARYWKVRRWPPRRGVPARGGGGLSSRALGTPARQRLKWPVTVKEYGPVTSVHFSPSEPFDYAVSASARVRVFASATRTVRRTITRASRTSPTAPPWAATAGEGRCAGTPQSLSLSLLFPPCGPCRLRRRPRRRLLAAGGASAVVQIFDLSSRALLRQLHGHRQAVRVACFSPGGAAQQLLSASDDRTLRLWDVALGHCLRVLPGHADAVRAAVPLGDGAGGGQLWLSGSYDHAVRLWDARCPAAASATVLALDHGAPVEAVLVVGGGLGLGGALAVSAGGTALGPGRRGPPPPPRCLARSRRRPCTHHHGARLCAGVAARAQRLPRRAREGLRPDRRPRRPRPALRRADPLPGRVARRAPPGRGHVQRLLHGAPPPPRARGEPPARRGGTYRFLVRGMGREPGSDDYAVEAAAAAARQRRRQRRLRPYDAMLRKFRYGAALDAALARGQRAVVAVSVLEELVRRDGLTIALQGRDDERLEPLLRFLVRHVVNPRYAALLVEVAGMALDLYAERIGQSMAIDEHFMRLQRKIETECALASELTSLLGALDCLMASAP